MWEPLKLLMITWFISDINWYLPFSLYNLYTKPPPPLVKATSDHSRSSVTSCRQRSTLRSMAPGAFGSQSVIGSEVDKKQGGGSKTGRSRTGKTVDGTSRVGMDEDDIEVSRITVGIIFIPCSIH